MPAFASLLWGMFLSIAGSLVKRVLLSIGFGVITFVGSKYTLDWFIERSISKLNGLPSDLLGVLSICGLGNCISIITSAITIRMILGGLSLVNDRSMNLKFLGNKGF